MLASLARFLSLTCLTFLLASATAQSADSASSIKLSLLPPLNARHVFDTRLTMVTDLSPATADSKDMFPLTTKARLLQRIERTGTESLKPQQLKLSTETQAMEMHLANGLVHSLQVASLPPPIRLQAQELGNRFEPTLIEGTEKLRISKPALDLMIRNVFEGLSALNQVPFAVGQAKALPFITDYPLPMSFGSSESGLLRATYTLVSVEDGIARFDLVIDANEKPLQLGDAKPATQGSRDAQTRVEARGTGMMRVRLIDNLRLLSVMDLQVKISSRDANGMQQVQFMKLLSESTGREERE